MTGSFEDIKELVRELHQKYASFTEGTVASYIPELAKANPNHFGISVVDIDGEVFEIGDCSQKFTIQSAINPIIHGLALEHVGPDTVEHRIGLEPSGNPFNSISLAERTRGPENPMINAGAICLTDMIRGENPTQRLSEVLSAVERYAGEELGVDMLVYSSEKLTGHRNRAIAEFLVNFGLLHNPPEQVLDLYFQQCSISLNCTQLATVAATLANRGLNPRTGILAVAPDYLRHILSVMFSCGMYEITGQWAYDVGLPAKSGIGGGLFAVVPGCMGVAVYSPPLGRGGATARGVKVLRELSDRLNLHLMSARHGDFHRNSDPEP